MGNTEPRHKLANPRPERIATVILSGCDFVVAWDGEPGEPDTYCDGHVSVRGIKSMIAEGKSRAEILEAWGPDDDEDEDA